MSRLFFILILYLISTNLFAQETINVNIDLGGSETELPWNTLTNSTAGELLNLIATNGQATDIGIRVSDDFNGTNTNGAVGLDPNLDFPDFATEDSFFGNQLEWNGIIQETGAVTLNNLDPQKLYQIELFASRLAGDNRETQYRVTGNNVDTTLFLNAADNNSELASATNIRPNTSGEIIIEVSAGPNNDNEFGFYYLGIIRLQYEDVVKEVEPMLTLTSPTGDEYYQTGKTPEIRWESKGIDEVNLEFSSDSGATWAPITTANALTQKYDWTIPNLNSEDCLIRISADTIAKISNEEFLITNIDTTSCHIVVLGSSTAAGTGPTSLDSAWVWLYRDILFQNDTRFDITNLARGGFTTYNILPTSTSIPTSVNQSIDLERNVSKALSLNPNAVIINLPSNDAANGFTVDQQLENYDLILEELDQLEIPYWICTPQPRNNFSVEQKSIQTDMRDSTFSRFGEFAIDFWTTLATADDVVDNLYNSGDGVHLNNAGHRILIERVLQKNINAYLLDSKTETSSNTLQNDTLELIVFPNPSNQSIKIENVSPPFSIKIYNSLGQILEQQEDYNKQKVELPISGLHYISITKGEKIFGTWIVRK